LATALEWKTSGHQWLLPATSSYLHDHILQLFLDNVFVVHSPATVMESSPRIYERCMQS
jgi:hypothetical protein